jgi:hypothetical protein
VADAVVCAGHTSSVLSYPAGAQKCVYPGGSDQPNSTPCNSGRLNGTMGTYNGPWGVPTCGANDYPYVNLTVRLNPVPAYPAPAGTVNLSNNSYISTLPGTGASGLRFKAKLGPNHMPGMVYKVYLNRASATDGDQYYVKLAADAAGLTTSWKTFNVPFPADGSTSVAHANSGDGSAAVTELTWAQDQYAGTAVTWGRTDFIEFGIGLIVRGATGDMLIDDVEFY